MNQIGQGTGIPVPAELNDKNANPEARAKMLDLYTAALMERPQSTWNATERAAVHEKALSVMRGMGY